MGRSFNLLPAALLLILSSFSPAAAQHQMENLGRGLVAVSTGGSNVFLSWRMLGTDPANVAFNVYRGTTKLNATPITNVTSYTDTAGGTGQTYSVRPVIGGVEQGTYNTVTGNVWGGQYLQLNLQRPAGGTTPDNVAYTYAPNDCSVGDVDGDGEYELIVKWYPSNAQDNANDGYTGSCLLDCYRLNGTRLWRIDLGINIRSGAHYTQFQVYDYDGDGRAEMMCKTAPGSRDSSGAFLSMGPAASDVDSTDYRSSVGRILSGPEYLTVFNGLTGREMATINYNPPRGTVGNWGDTYGNRVDRFLAGTAFLDGQRPTAVFCRGYYTRTTLWAVDWRNNQLTQRWFFDTNTAGTQYAGKGNHQLSVADVDADGRDEIIYGALTINDNGTVMYASTWGHADALHVADISPSNPGLEIWDPNESANGTATGPTCSLRDARTGTVLWYKTGSGDIGRAMSSDITAAHPGMECWAAGGNGLYNAQGTQIGTINVPINFAAWWDGDLLREMLDGITLSKYNVGALLTASGCVSINGTKGNPCLSADFLGDWREEVIWPTSDGQSVRIFTTTNTTTYRFYTLMHDSQYRSAITWQNTAYNQPPHPSFFLGDGMTYPVPQPNIMVPGGSNTPTRTNTPSVPTPTRTATRTNTVVPPTATATRTNSPVPPTATATRTATLTASRTATPSSTNTLVPPTSTRTLTSTPSRTATASSTSTPMPPTLTATSTPSRTATASSTNTSVPPTSTPSRTATPSSTSTSVPPTLTATLTLSRTPTASSTSTTVPPTSTLTSSATATSTRTATSSSTATTSFTASATRTPTLTATPSVTLTPTGTLPPTQTSTLSSTWTASPTATASRTPTSSSTVTLSMTPTLTASATSSRTATSSSTATSTPSSTATFSSTPSRTATASATASPTLTLSPTGTLPPTQTSTLSSTPTATASLTRTATSTSSATPSSTPTSTASPTFTATLVFTPTATLTLTSSPSRTATPSATLTATPTLSGTSTATSTSTMTSSLTRTATPTATASFTSTPTATTTSTVSATSTASPTPTLSATSSVTSTVTVTSSPTMTAGSNPVIFPNPVLTGTVVLLPQAHNSAEDVTVCIYTAGYKLVARKNFYGVLPGQLVQVALVDNWGQSLGNGVYYVVVMVGQDRKTTTLVLAR